MGSVPSALVFLLMIFAGQVNWQQLITIDFLKAENQMVKGRLRGRRIRFTKAERALLARKAKAIGRKALLEVDTIVPLDWWYLCQADWAAWSTARRPLASR